MKKNTKIAGKLLSPVLKSKNCLSCRTCCKFGENDCFDAPMFTEEEKNDILAKFTGLSFKKVGKLWKVDLATSPRKKISRYVCPFYDENKYKCLIYNIRPFDCLTWPFYIMKLHDKVIVTLSKDCPVVLNVKLDYLLEFAEKIMAPYMVKSAQKYPDLITPYHNEAVMLLDVTDKF